MKWRSERRGFLQCLGVRVKPGLNKESRGMKETTGLCGKGHEGGKKETKKDPWLVKPHQ